MRWAAAAILAGCLVACGHKSHQSSGTNSSAAPPTGRENGAMDAANGPANQSSSPAEQNGPGTLPPSNGPPSFIGLWAASKADCKSSPWRFTKTELAAVNGPHCSIYEVTKVADGYDLGAQCPDKKPIPTDLIKIRFAQSPEAMLVESNTIPPHGLVYCRK